MIKTLYDLTNGSPRSLVLPSVAALSEALANAVPAVLVLGVFTTIFEHYQTGEPLQVSRLWLVAGVLGLWLLVQWLAAGWAYDREYATAYVTSARGRKALSERLRKLSLGFFGSRDPGDLSTRMLGDYEAVERAISHFVPQLIGAVFLSIVAFVALLVVRWEMALAMFITLPAAVLVTYVFRNLMTKLNRSQVEAAVDATSRLQEYLFGMREIKAHNLSGARFERLREAYERLTRASYVTEGLLCPVLMVAIGLLGAGLMVVVIVGSFMLEDGGLTLALFLVFVLLAVRVNEPLVVAMAFYVAFRFSAESAERIMEVMEHPVPPGDGAPPRDSTIAFEDVTFAYLEDDVLKKVSFTVEPRMITALVGPSGSGKSTIARLIARFWDVQGGCIRLGGRDVTEIDPERLLSRISMVFQDVHLFKDTIGNNIRVGRMDASQEEIEAAARKACCHDFITALPQGYDTPVGEGGCTLSGGERQRISIARALLKDAPIVLLDEATAYLDPENEINVQRAINALVADKTVVIIAHRLKTVRGADKIIVLDDGHVVEEGRHEELLSRQGLYHRLWTLQQQAAGWRMKAA